MKSIKFFFILLIVNCALFISTTSAQWWIQGGNLLWPYGDVTINKKLIVKDTLFLNNEYNSGNISTKTLNINFPNQDYINMNLNAANTAEFLTAGSGLFNFYSTYYNNHSIYFNEDQFNINFPDKYLAFNNDGLSTYFPESFEFSLNSNLGDQDLIFDGSEFTLRGALNNLFFFDDDEFKIQQPGDVYLEFYSNSTPQQLLFDPGNFQVRFDNNNSFVYEPNQFLLRRNGNDIFQMDNDIEFNPPEDFIVNFKDEFYLINEGLGNNSNIYWSGDDLVLGDFNKVDVDGNLVVNSLQYDFIGDDIPASSSASGETGQIRIDANYIYVCTTTNTWKRIALSTW